MQAVKLARANDINKLVVWRLDRLGRDSGEYIPVLKTLKRLGVDVASVTQPTEGIFMQEIFGVMAEEESRQLSVRVTASKQRRFEEGKWGTPAPFGYDNQKDPEGGSILRPNMEGPIVTEMFERYASGKHSLSDLLHYLNENDYLKSRGAVSYMLKNPVYLGVVQHGRFARSQFMPKPEVTESQGKHRPLVDRETFDKVQERLATNKNRARGGVRPKYMFSGLIHCAGCGHKYVGRTSAGHGGRHWIQYRCNRRQSFGDCNSHSVFETRVREVVMPPIETLLSRLSEQDVWAAVREEFAQQEESTRASTQQTREGLAETQRRLEVRLSRLEDQYLDADLSRDRYLIRRDEITAELREIQGQLAEQPKIVVPDIEPVLAIAESITLGTLDDQAWRQIIEAMVDRIVIEGPSTEADGRRSPAAIRVVWKPEYELLLALVANGEWAGDGATS